MNEKVNLPVLEALADRREWTIALVGRENYKVPEEKARFLALTERPNVHWFGHRPFDLVPAYIKGLDVCMMCYVINNWTFYGDPSKLHEYLASGKPTIGTGLPSIREFADVVQIPETPPEWVAAVERALQEQRPGAGRAADRDGEAESYQARIERFRTVVGEALREGAARPRGARRTHMTTDIRSSDQPLVSVVVPCFNEEDVIAETYRRLTAVLGGSGQARFELIFVNDGSRDRSLEMLRASGGDPSVRVVSFSRNFGHQVAITAGVDHAAGDAVVLIDADLQDPPEVILEMLAKWRDGDDVVYGVRSEREGETAFKLLTAKWFYRMIAAMTDVPIPLDTGDFRLMDRRVVDELRRCARATASCAAWCPGSASVRSRSSTIARRASPARPSTR